MEIIYRGIVSEGFGIASGRSVGTAANPFSAGSLATQAPLFASAGVDLEALVPGLVWGTINIRLEDELVLNRPDYVARDIDWTTGEEGEARIAPETFSFIHCRLAYPCGSNGEPGAHYPGLIYYPHPETKPNTNSHYYDRLEVLTSLVPNLIPGTPASIVCRADAFRLR